MEIREDASYAYWLLLKRFRLLEQLKQKNLIHEDSYLHYLEQTKDELQLEEPLERLMDAAYMEKLAESYGHDAESCPIPSIRARAQAKKAANINPRYECFTDIVKRRNSELTPSYALQCWLRNRNSVEFMMLWERKYNPDFHANEASNLIRELEVKNSGMTLKQWVSRTNAIGIVTLQGRYGGTYADPTIAMDFEAWLSPKYRFLTFMGYCASEERKYERRYL
jgi:hypothetical protein